jgi:hypothetical protein
MALHWNWMVAMTKQMLSPSRRQASQEPSSDLAYGGAEGRSLSRRAFLAFGGTATAVIVAAAVGSQVTRGANPVDAGESDTQIAATQQEGGVACPFGLVNDPYPGRCRHYRDSIGDGYCDYSVPGSGSNLSTSDHGSFDGGLSRHHGGLGRP